MIKYCTASVFWSSQNIILTHMMRYSPWGLTNLNKNEWGTQLDSTFWLASFWLICHRLTSWSIWGLTNLTPLRAHHMDTYWAISRSWEANRVGCLLMIPHFHVDLIISKRAWGFVNLRKLNPVQQKNLLELCAFVKDWLRCDRSLAQEHTKEHTLAPCLESNALERAGGRQCWNAD